MSALTQNVHLTWIKGGAASVLTVHDDMITLKSSIPAPPGARLEASFQGDDTAPPAPMKVKIHGSKLESDGTYTLRGRLIDADRAFRERVASVVPRKGS